MSFDSLVFGNAIPGFSFDMDDKDALTVRGRVTGSGAVHRREYLENGKQGKPLYWGDDGKPTTRHTSADQRKVETPTLTVQTALSNWEGVLEDKRKGEDDGIRRIFFTDRAKSPVDSVMGAFRAACMSKGIKSAADVAFVEVTLTGEGKAPSRGARKPKLYKAEVWTADAPPAWADEIPTAPEPGEDDGFEDEDEDAGMSADANPFK